MSKRLSPLTNIKNNLDSQHIELTTNDDIPVSSYGTHLCRSGISSPVSYGHVEAFNLVTYGDSGGPSFSFSSLASVPLKGIVWEVQGKEVLLVLLVSYCH
ncbi:hypothetical protein F8M41_025907 [Gigaspora margarita]|uniref:Peptidase S1 domain-containing protein n=1 Tax=Gigaspora margarita TaxID=4874 RepID=A0A8H3XHQ0_GIGMA|nr:hypothetical protein F8M41_025907 [Gigaspora margarita]